MGGKNDENNELSSTWPEFIELEKPTCGTFENVMGLWRRKHLPYLRRILLSLMRMNHQFRVAKLFACDYGDPQRRPRLIIVAAHPDAELPPLPVKTHGEGKPSPRVSFQKALEHIAHLPTSQREELQGMDFRQATDSAERFRAHRPALTVRCSKAIRHFEEDRCLFVRELAALQSIPLDYEFHGTLQQQRQQVGNAVSVRMAKAIATSVAETLRYHYKMSDGEGVL